MSSADPLGFFAGDASSSSEEEEDEDESKDTGSTELQEPPEGSSADKLPSPDTLFATVGRPSFLDDPQEGQVNWDRFVKTQETSPEPDVHGGRGYAAIPPPTLDDSSTLSTGNGANQISAAPVRYSTPSETTDPKLLTVSSSTGNDNTALKPGSKRPHREPEEEGEGSGGKKPKAETFRTKEKRKRDLGQTSRGKSYVEEEKRILRQSYGDEKS